MNIYISLIRGINVGGKKLLMTELKDIYNIMGFEGVKSYIQSGNIIFKSAKENIKELEEEIENEILKSHFQVAVLIRTLDEFKQILHNNPYLDEDPGKIYVTFLKEKSDQTLKHMIEGKEANESYQIKNREIYLYLPNGYGRTKINNNFLERQFNLKATTRNWRTVNRLYELAQELK
jgi:uncharacterized protein (DUF1697 family)